MNSDVTNSILRAMQSMIEKNIAKLKFDKTIAAKIIEYDKSRNKYLVSYGGKEMYVKERHGNTYTTMDTVWILIPCGSIEDAFII